MGRTAPFVAAPRHDAGVPSGSGESGKDIGMDKVMAELALAFARDIEIADAGPVGEKWPMGWSLAFIVVSSVALWVLIAVLIAAVL